MEKKHEVGLEVSTDDDTTEGEDPPAGHRPMRGLAGWQPDSLGRGRYQQAVRERTFLVVPTGSRWDPEHEMVYLGTAMGESLVFHVYELVA